MWDDHRLLNHTANLLFGLAAAGLLYAVLMVVRATGSRDGRPAEEVFSSRIEQQEAAGNHGGLALASATHAAALIDLLRDGALDGDVLRCPALLPHEMVIASRHFETLRLRS